MILDLSGVVTHSVNEHLHLLIGGTGSLNTKMKCVSVLAVFLLGIAGINATVLLANAIRKEAEHLHDSMLSRGIFNREEIELSLKILNTFNHTEYKPLDKILPGYGTTWMFIPGGDGKPRIVDMTAAKSYPKTRYDLENAVAFHLYTRDNVYESRRIYLNDLKNEIPGFDLSKDIKFITHGWISTYTDDVCQKVKNAYLKTEDVNVICVDWFPIAKDLSYYGPAYETRNVGNYIAQFVDNLVDNGVNPDKVHLLGWSLGSHVMGTAGYYFSKGKIGRITGFDPARPAFELFQSREYKLDSSDAAFVDIIHTCGGVLGYLEPFGHVDFYPNAGFPPQPGCVGLPQLTEACSHSRSYEYYAEAVLNRNNFVGVECPNFIMYKTKGCMSNKVIPLGPNTPRTARGKYMLDTNHESPFARENPYKFMNPLSILQHPVHLRPE